MNDQPTSDGDQLRSVSRADVRPSPKQTRLEMRSFSLLRGGNTLRIVLLSLAFLLACSGLIFLVDQISALLFNSLHSGERAAIATGVVALLTMTLFMRTDPPGGAGGLLGENDERVWSVRRPGRIHWLMTGLLVVVLIVLSL